MASDPLLNGYLTRCEASHLVSQALRGRQTCPGSSIVKNA